MIKPAGPPWLGPESPFPPRPNRGADPRAQVKGKPAATRWRVPWLLFAGAVAVASPAGAQPGGQAPRPGAAGPAVGLATTAPPLAVGQADGLLVVPLGLHGTDWFSLSDATGTPSPGALRPRPTNEPTWPTVSLCDLEGPGFLLAGRDDQVRHVISDPPGAPPVLALSWTIEGMANAVAVSGEVVAVAGGGGGLGVWHWPDRTQPPRLKGRYPFIEFGRDLLFVDPTTVAIADSLAGQVVFVDLADPMRPRRVGQLAARSGFADQLDYDGVRLAFSDRLGGAGIAQRTPPAGQWAVTHRLPDPGPDEDSRTRFLDVTLGSGMLYVCSDDAGWRAWHHHAAARGSAESWQPVAPPPLVGNRPVATALLDGGRLAVALAKGGVEIVAVGGGD